MSAIVTMPCCHEEKTGLCGSGGTNGSLGVGEWVGIGFPVAHTGIRIEVASNIAIVPAKALLDVVLRTH